MSIILRTEVYTYRMNIKNNNNWTIQQTVDLFKLCERARGRGESLTVAFEETARKTGRSVNSVRNYYYGQSKTFELVPEVAERLGIRPAGVRRDGFVPFTQSEVEELIKNVLTAKGRGKSVRAAIFDLAGGDAKKALRLQNKYRSVLRSHRALVENIMRSLDAEGIPYRDPYEKQSGGDNFARLTEYIAALDSARVGKFLSLIEKLT